MIQNWLKLLLLLVLIGSLCQSCVRHRELVSLNGNEAVPDDLRGEKVIAENKLHYFTPYKIRPFDQLLIRINSFNGNTEEFLDREFGVGNNNGMNINYEPNALYFNSYTVDSAGYVVLPMIDKLKVAGRSVTRIKELLDEAYTPFLKYPSTNVKLANWRFTVLGEVNEPGVYYLNNEQTSLVDAISMAGDFTDFGNRKKVKIYRQISNGQSRSVYVNISRSDFLYTEYYYIQPSDVIYIEPVKGKAWDVSSRSVGVVISGISLGLLLLNVFTDFRK